MQEVLTYFDTIPTHVRAIILVSGILFFLILEAGTPLFRFDYKKGKHAVINITFTFQIRFYLRKLQHINFDKIWSPFIST